MYLLRGSQIGADCGTNMADAAVLPQTCAKTAGCGAFGRIGPSLCGAFCDERGKAGVLSSAEAARARMDGARTAALGGLDRAVCSGGLRRRPRLCFREGWRT